MIARVATVATPSGGLFTGRVVKALGPRLTAVERRGRVVAGPECDPTRRPS